MATPPSLCIEKLKQALDSAEIGQHPVEVHGALVGLICGGVDQAKLAWQKPLLELMNDGQAVSTELQQLINELFQDTATRLSDAEFGFTPLLPEEEELLSLRLECLALWVQSYLTAIALIQPKLNGASTDVREIIQDLGAIAQVEFDVSDDDESEAAFIELHEFVRMAAILCYSEFGPEMPLDEESPLAPLH
ncbi:MULTISPECIES: UPF0149 family protein [unclassified Shewanella]|uniref:UPF0149 family protein n=1 Tax=unclassified Shewanella TaxID=196818 RepID=UPI000C8273A0|nr:MULTISPECIES: UPF0149 family protein [unclassified Shewanella]MDO6619773.1 UPF0149 family protein [Shewanella sp. 6_MG-2023]MDO6638703.1 UPF0149 family protein [Shewanella sp. 5_MG-2023]MDO6774137.1 UPF0149 family protein [Shewanella sp. 3_MG-2023]PMH89277.1 hypothetical protein BCU57_03085 [Shewanella sp. 10N.286.48.B5]PMH94713.1 hypothetical protein BCU55_03545 [Shewanella sp. 10N.286.48.A6]